YSRRHVAPRHLGYDVTRGALERISGQGRQTRGTPIRRGARRVRATVAHARKDHGMNVVQLEKELNAAKEKARGLIETTAKRCKDHVVTAETATAPAVVGRLMTDEEKAAINAVLAEAEAIQKRIDGAKSDAEFMARVESFTGGPARVPAGSSLAT